MRGETERVRVRVATLREAIAELIICMPVPDDGVPQSAELLAHALAADEPLRTVTISQRSAQRLVDLLERTEPVCDHSVGICACDTLTVMNDLSLAMDGVRVCPGCGGMGWGDFIDDEHELGSYAPDCYNCLGSGTVPA